MKDKKRRKKGKSNFYLEAPSKLVLKKWIYKYLITTHQHYVYFFLDQVMLFYWLFYMSNE